MMKNLLYILLFISAKTLAQIEYLQLTGLVFNTKNNEPIAMCNVFLKQSGKSTKTDLNGYFKIDSVPTGKSTVVLYCLEFDTLITDVLVKKESYNMFEFYMKGFGVVLSDKMPYSQVAIIDAGTPRQESVRRVEYVRMEEIQKAKQHNKLKRTPFDYGQNKQVYFLSREKRKQVGLNNIYIIEENLKNDLGGMGELWDVSLITFDTSTVTDDWYPMRSLDENFKYNFDSIVSKMEFLNGTGYEFSNGSLSHYGGGGYGTFEVKDIDRLDTVSYITTSCAGHCSTSYLESYSKNVFSQKGQLLYTVFYSKQSQSDSTKPELNCIMDYELFLKGNTNENNYNDTAFYKYDKEGRILKISKELSIKNSVDVQKLFGNPSDPSGYQFHQCYIGKTKMEKFIKQKLGYIPKLLLIEIYSHGVFSFTFNELDHKFYRTETIVLEK